MKLLGLLFLAMLCATALAQETKPAQTPSLEDLVARIARADGPEAEEAVQALIARTIRPVAEAFGDLQARPLAERRRLLDALGSLSGALRFEVYARTLPSEDRRLLEQCRASHPRLVTMLLHDNADIRRAALQQIPLRPDEPESILIAAALQDWDYEIRDAAWELAARLEDDVIRRALLRQLEQVVRDAKSGDLRPNEVAYLIVWADEARRAINLLGKMAATEAGPAVIEAVETYGRPPTLREFWVGDALGVLGRFGDERAVPTLLRFLESGEVHGVVRLEEDTVRQTVGDVALLALVRIYGLDAAALGFQAHAETGEPAGLADDEARRTAVRQFLIWHEKNATRPAAEREPLAPRSGNGK